ncbi:NAD-dependent epimerase/dehydratase family protein [Planctomycetota bacterium]
MRKSILITGICGFAGRHMCDFLAGLSERPKIIGADIIGTQPDHCDAFFKADLTSPKETEHILRETLPDFIIHFAGTFNAENIQEMFKANVLSIITLLEAARECVPYAVIIAAGSAAEYGAIEPDQLPVDEQTPCRPVTYYGLSKQSATQTALYYHRIHKISTMVVRPFQLIGPGLTPKLAPGAFAQKLKELRTTGLKTFQVGNLESWRDFLDVYDAAEAIWALCQNPAPGEIFNLCSGEPTKIADLLQMMIDYSSTEVEIEIDPSRMRGRNDVTKVYGSYQKIRNHCGWEPKRSLSQTLKAMLV